MFRNFRPLHVEPDPKQLKLSTPSLGPNLCAFARCRFLERYLAQTRLGIPIDLVES
jgi:hypothetical protein